MKSEKESDKEENKYEEGEVSQNEERVGDKQKRKKIIMIWRRMANKSNQCKRRKKQKRKRNDRKK